MTFYLAAKVLFAYLSPFARYSQSKRARHLILYDGPWSDVSTPFESPYLTSYLVAIIMSFVSAAICEIFAYKMKMSNLTLKLKVRINEEKAGLEPFD